jgi:hypothetical protein
MKHKSILYHQEQLEIENKIIELLNLKNNSITLYELADIILTSLK